MSLVVNYCTERRGTGTDPSSLYVCVPMFELCNSALNLDTTWCIDIYKPRSDMHFKVVKFEDPYLAFKQMANLLKIGT